MIKREYSVASLVMCEHGSTKQLVHDGEGEQTLCLLTQYKIIQTAC
jgi:hypothetical protein